jgi:hypothetical protein
MLLLLVYLMDAISSEQVTQHQLQQMIQSGNWEQQTATLTSYQY